MKLTINHGRPTLSNYYYTMLFTHACQCRMTGTADFLTNGGRDHLRLLPCGRRCTHGCRGRHQQRSRALWWSR